MSEWKECRLADVAEVQTGPFGSQLHQRDYRLEGTPIITVEHIGDNRIVHSDLPLVGEEDRTRLKRYLLKTGDIVFSRVGSVDRCAYVHQSENGWMFSGRLLRVRSREEKVDPRFLSFYFSQESFKETVRMIAVGATMPSINTSILSELDILLPPLPEQRAIAGVLSSLDDKINLLHRQNKTLEGMAEAVFRKWFVEERNNSATACLNDYVSCINGISYKSSELNPSKTALVTLKSFNRYGGFSVDGFKQFTGRHKVQQIVLEGDLVVAHTDITQEAEVLGNPALIISSPIYDTLVISMDLVKVVPKIDWVSKEFLYFLMRSREFKHHCLGCANGTTVLHLNKEAIPTFEFSIPDKSKVIEFTKLAKDLIRQVFVKHRQIHTLSRLRDTLLPKLMSGEVRVRL